MHKFEVNSEELNVADEYKKNTVEENQAISKDKRHDASICVLSVTGGLNISTIIRTSHNLGFKENIILGKTKFDRRGLVGAQNYSEITKIEGLTENGEIDSDVFMTTMVEKDLFPIFVETGGILLNEVHWGNMLKNYIRLDQSRPCFIFGNEQEGIPQNILDTADEFAMSFTVSIPNLGIMRSYNVATAASIVMWDYVAKMGLV